MPRVKRWTSRKLFIWLACMVLFVALRMKDYINEDNFVHLIDTLLWAFFLANAGIAIAGKFKPENKPDANGEG